MSGAADWELVAVLYADRSIPLREIARRCGVSATAISAWAKRRGLPPRKARKRKPRPEPNVRMLLVRIHRSLERQMRELEQRMAQAPAEARSPADRERDARTLGHLTRIFEKLRDLEREAARTEAASPADDTEKTDRESLRLELERRLDRLLAASEAAEVPE